MKILLINPPYAFPIIREGRCQSPQDMRKNSIPQMTLAYLAGLLNSEGHNLKVFDCIASAMTIENLFAHLDSFVPELALINTCTPTITSDMSFISSLKQRYPNIVTAVFGTHVTALHRQILEENRSLDLVIRTEPENAVKEVIDWAQNGRRKSEIRNCTVRVGENIIDYEQGSLESNLDSYGFPDWEYLPIENYIHPVFNKPYLMVNTSRGCKHGCIFCVAHQFYGKKVRFRSVSSIIEEIKRDIDRFQVRHFWFYADDFTCDVEFVKQLCRAIIDSRLNIVWWSNTRVDKQDSEMFALMKESGCYMLSIGGESGSSTVLKRIRKGTNPEEIVSTVRILRKVGINSLVYFLIGLPGENRQTMRETIDFAKRANPDYVEFYPATPYPGTEFYNIAMKEKMIVEFDWASYQCGGNRFVIQLPGLDKDELDSILRRAYREFYFRPAYALVLLRKAMNPRDFIRLMGFAQGYFKRFVSRRGPDKRDS